MECNPPPKASVRSNRKLLREQRETGMLSKLRSGINWWELNATSCLARDRAIIEVALEVERRKTL